MKAKLGLAPIASWNDDLVELADDVGLEESLRQASDAGFASMETEAEPDPRVLPAPEMAKKGHREVLRVMAVTGYEVVQ